MRRVNKNYEEERVLEKLRNKWKIKGESLAGTGLHFSGFYTRKGIEVGAIYAKNEYVILIEHPSLHSRVIPQYNDSFVTQDWYEWDGEHIIMEFLDTIDLAIHNDDMSVLRKALDIAGDSSFELTIERLYGTRTGIARKAYLLVKRGWGRTEKYTYDEELPIEEWRSEFIRL